MSSTTPALVGKYFSLPFFPPQRQRSQILQSRKRKRSDFVTGNDDDSETEAQTTVSDADASYPTHISQQYRVAGQPFTKEVPQRDFPHRAASSSESLPFSDIAQELETLDRPIHLSAFWKSDLPQTSEKQRHVAVLTTIMHESLLRGDYLRAGRAFALLLRSEISGRQPDIRSGGMWGLGAELLLRRAIHGDHLGDSRDGPSYSRCYSERGFDDARKYFERLILDFPCTRLRPNAADFYPTLFSLWIGVIQEQQTQAFARLQNERVGDDSDDSDDSSGISTGQGPQAERRIYKIVLDKAHEIRGRLEEVLRAPAYSQDSYLVNLKKSVSMWIISLDSQQPLSSGEQRGPLDRGSSFEYTDV
ncbi:MAG: hypothetical protein MMC23_006233 [Stictis urceolatum]|nr:hypothetical protein [Stictis urceolata]